MKTKFGLGEEVYVKAEIVDIFDDDRANVSPCYEVNVTVTNGVAKYPWTIWLDGDQLERREQK